MLFCKMGFMPAYAETLIQAPMQASTQVFIQSSSAINTTCFSDQDLSNIRQALVYVWSPRMVLSDIG